MIGDHEWPRDWPGVPSLHDDGDSAEDLAFFLLAMGAIDDPMGPGSWRAYLSGMGRGVRVAADAGPSEGGPP